MNTQTRLAETNKATGLQAQKHVWSSVREHKTAAQPNAELFTESRITALLA